MSTEKLVENLGKQLDRRKFLRNVGAAILSALVALMGSPGSAAAYTFGCCNLCLPPSGSVPVNGASPI